MDATKTDRVVFTGTWAWWEIVSRDGEIETGEPWKGDWERAAEAAGTDLDDEESWVCRVTGDTGRHTAIREGDYVCCYGCDVVFVRLSE